jgi:hypothetical protein
MTRRNRFRTFALLPLLFATSCAPARPTEGLSVPETLARHTCFAVGQPFHNENASGRFNLEDAERQRPAREQVFRHKAHVRFSGKTADFSFDGIMRVRAGAAGPVIRVVCLGALGLTLCDMTVTPEGYSVKYLHPALARTPDVARHIALCIRSVWFASLPFAGHEEKNIVLRERRDDTPLERLSGEDGRRVVRALGPKTFWTVEYVPAEPQPRLVTFRNESDGYTVRIRFVAEQDERGQTP